MKYKELLVIGVIILLGNPITVYTQQNHGHTNNDGVYRIMFYNVENLFDIYDDSLTNDNEFLENGAKNWTYYKFKQKINNLAKVITAVGEWGTVDVIGLAEIENEYVLSALLKHDLLKAYHYEVIHRDSPDSRGIDVALLYRSDRLNLIESSFITVQDNEFSLLRTREILAAKLQLLSEEVVHIYVNHWSSRLGGQLQSEPKRVLASKLLKKEVENILLQYPNGKIIIMGDFNDEPDDKSLSQTLGASLDINKEGSSLYNLMAPYIGRKGTMSYQGRWQIFDQFIISSSLLSGNVKVLGNIGHIVDFDFLTKESVDGTSRPYRTYQGPIYLGGFSDHYPIYFDLHVDE